MSERPPNDELRVRLVDIVKGRADRLVVAFSELEQVLIDIKEHGAELIAYEHEEDRLRDEIIALGGEAGLL